MAEQSLFGTTPEELMASRDAALRQQAAQYAQLDPFQQATMGIYQGASKLGGVVGGLLGGQDPEMMRIKQRQQLLQGVNPEDPDSMLQAAMKASQMGDYGAAQELSTKARAMQLQMAQLGKVQEESARLRGANIKEDKLSTELAALTPDATDADVEAVVRKYGKPEAVLASLARKQQTAAQLEAKASLEADKAAAKVEAAALQDQRNKENIALRAQLASSTNDLQRQLLQTKIDDLQAKKTEKGEKQEAAKAVAIRHATNVIKDVEEAIPLVGNLTTGLIGKAASVVPGTPAYTLNNRVSTIKANLGFDRLQQMRDASPTGGALGQVAVQELQALQNSVASLEVGQDKKELEKNLGKIKEHYTKWLESTQGIIPKAKTDFTSVGEANAANLPKGTMITINGRKVVVE